MQYIDCNINPISRVVSYPGATIVQRDTNVEALRFHFSLDAEYELENDSIRIMVLKDGKTNGFNAENVRVETNDGGDEELVFEHTITTHETATPGQIAISVCGNQVSGNNITEAWHTLNMVFQVSSAAHSESDEGEDTPETIASNAEKIAALQTLVDAITSGRPIPVDLKSKMTDTSAIYLYTGSETGEQHNYWYYHDGTSWVPGSEYGGMTIDDELSSTSENAVQNKVIKANFDEINGRLTQQQTDIDAIRETNILYDESSVVVSGTGQYVFEKIFEITNVTVGDVYSISFSSVTGETAASTVGYVDAYAGTTRKKRTNLRKENKFATYTVEENVDKVEFLLYPSQTGATTATYTDVKIYKGDEPQLSIKRDVLPDLNISPQDTTFFYKGINIFDPETIITGQYVNQTNGNFANNSNYSRTPHIKVESSESYLIKSSKSESNYEVRYAFYDANKTFISGSGGYVTASYVIVTAPANAAFMACSLGNTRFPFMIARSEVDKQFEPYGLTYIMPEYVADSVESVPVNLPDKIYATSGIELNIYFENLTENWEKYNWNVTCPKGMQLERGYRFTPTDSDEGTYTLNIDISPKDNWSISKRITSTLIVTASATGNSNKSIIILGDSTTDSGTVIEKLHENLTNITTLGTRGTSPNNHEGRSGWTLTGYFTKASETYTDGRGTIYNPFYNPNTHTFDADYYFTNSGVSKPDWFIVNMGINDMFSPLKDDDAEEKATVCIGYLDDIVNSVLSAAPNTNVAICVTIPPNHSQDAFGKAYGCEQTRDRCKRNNVLWADAIIRHFADNSDVYIIPIHTNLDTVYNMGMETLPVNARNTDVTYQSPVRNGGVHPSTSGYWQIADVYTAFIKAHA